MKLGKMENCVRGKAVVVHFDFIEKKSIPIPDSIRAQLAEHIMPEEL